MAEQHTSLKCLQPGEIVLDWIPKHWPLTPIGTNKNPYIPNWQNDAKTIEDIAEQINCGICKAVGLLSGPCFNQKYGLVWVDVDGPSVQDKVCELSHLLYRDALPPTLTICSGKEGRERRLYSLSQSQMSNLIRNKYTWSTSTKNEKLEVLWKNHQGVLMGLHPETNGYYTPVGCGFEWADQLPPMPQWLLDAIISKNARLGPPIKQITRVEGPGFGFSLIRDIERDINTALEAMWSLPPEIADDYEAWVMVGIALHSVDEGLLDHWDSWSQQSEKYEPGVCERKWQSFKSDNGIGLGTLIEYSKQYSNVMHQRLAIEAATAPSDGDLDFIEAIRQQEENIVDLAIVSQQQARQIQHISTVLDDIGDVIQESIGESLGNEAAQQWDEYIASGGMSFDQPLAVTTQPSATKQKNPPNNVIRDYILRSIGDTTVFDSTQEAFYRYEYHKPGTWSQLSIYEINAIIQDQLDQMNLARGFSAGTVQAVIDLLAPQLVFSDWNDNSNLLNFTNGVLDISTMELNAHDKEMHLVSQLPFDYDPGADCPKTKQWLSFTQYGNQEMVRVLQAWMRAVLLSRYDLQMFLEVVGAAGAGKAQPLTAPVLTPHGWIPMGTVRVGTTVCTPDGGTARVLGVFPQQAKEVYRLTFNDGSKAECCGEHLWPVQVDGSDVIMTLHEIMEYRNKYHLTADHENCNNVYVPLTKPVQQSFQAIGIDPYQAGIDLFLLQNDATAFKNAIDLASDDYVYATGNYACYFNNSISVRLGLLQGIMDTYGHLTSQGKCSVTLLNPQFVRPFTYLIRSLGGLIHFTEGSITTSDLTTKNALIQPVFTASFQLPMEACPFRSNQQKLKAYKTLSFPYYACHKYITAIEPIGCQEVQCIYVDHPQHLYITSDFTVTHNTSFANLCIALVGFQNTFSTRLNLLESNRFEVAGSYNKKLVVINDADRYGGNVEILKAMTGGDQLRMEIKYQKQMGTGFTYRGLIMTTANESIQTTDLTGGLFRRRLTIPFSRSRNVLAGDTPDKTMVGFDAQGNPFGYLVDELPGIVNWVLSMSDEDMIKYTKHAVDCVEVLRFHKADQLSENNNIMDWMNDRIIYDPMICTVIGERKETDGEYYYQHADKWLYPSYCDHCRKSNVREVGRRRFIALLEDICKHQLKIKIKVVRGLYNRHIFKGLAIRRNNDPTYDGHPSLVEYAFNQKKYEHLYGSEKQIQEQIQEEAFLSTRLQPSIQNDGIPELPF